MKKNVLFGVAFLMLATFMLVGCGKKGLIGDWVYFNGSTKDNSYYYTFTDEKNGSYTAFGNTRKFTYTDDGKKLTILYDGDTMDASYEYKLDGDTFTIKDSLGNDVTYKRK